MRASGALVLLSAGSWGGGAALLGETASGHARDLTHLLPTVYSRDIDLRPCDLPASSGRGGGVCSETVESVQSQLSFCRNSVRYRACIPAHQPPWDEWNATSKDALLGQLFKDMVEARLAREMNNTPDEFVERRLMSNPECIMAMRHLLCWYNFPKCDDVNRSLPLCRSSCERYYGACLFPPSPADGLQDACRAAEVARSGLFGTGAPGPDHLLAEDTSVCASTAEEADAILLEAEDERHWIWKPGGIVLLVACSLLLLALAYWLLVPYGLQAFIGWAMTRCLSGPLQTWRSLPVIKGNSILWAFVLGFLILVGVGVYRRLQLGLRYEHTGTDGNATAEGENWYIPAASIYTIETMRPLAKVQLRQLVGSCTCTGVAAHYGPSHAAWTCVGLLSLVAYISRPLH